MGPNHFDSALVADFQDMPAFRRYVSGPLHKPVWKITRATSLTGLRPSSTRSENVASQLIA
jgi:hypothetical protein